MNFKTERTKRVFLQAEIAKAMGMRQPHYARIESGARQPTKQQGASFRMVMMLIDYGKWQELIKGMTNEKV